jgi:release factor glutamine methyltransferase
VTLRVAVREAGRLLAAAGVPSAEHDARVLAAHVLGIPRFEPAVAPPPPPGFDEAFAEVVRRRAAREPLQHIVGWAPFRYLTLTVRPGVFVPRPETEVVAQVAIDEVGRLGSDGRSVLVVDLCCGAGGIAVAVASETGAQVVATDVSAEAVDLTRHNADDAGVVVQVELADVTDPTALRDLDGTVDVVVANPPYIPPDAVPIDPEVRDHDPATALYGGGADGLDVPRAVIAAAALLLRDGGLVVMEHADVQGAAVRAAVTASDAFDDAVTQQDLSGRDRMVVARRTARHPGRGPS